MKLRTVIILVMALIVALGLVSGVFAQSIQRALTLPSTPKHAAQQHTTGIPTQMQATASGSGTIPRQSSATVTPGQTPMAGTINILAQDTFQRTDQQLWGTASDGRVWESDANNQNNTNIFSIMNGTGVIMNAQGTLNAILGPAISDIDVQAIGSSSQFNGQLINVGVVVRWTDSNNWYKALIDGSNLTVLKRVKGVTTQLGTIPFPAQSGVLYTLRFRALGANLFAKVWPANTAEPAAWMLMLTDTTLTIGQAGVRVLLQNTAVVHITSFAETAASPIA